MKKKIIALCAIMLLASGCGKVPKLENGDDAIVSFKNGEKISVDDYFKMLKDQFGLESLVSMIDKYIGETEFPDYVETAEKNADAYIDAMVEQAGGKDEFLQLLREKTDYETIDAYKDYIYLSYLQSHMIEEYAKDQITDKEIEKYYNEKAIGDMEISHILITPDVKSDATSDETKKAEENAKKTVEEIIKKLDDAKKDKKDINETFKDLVKEYTKDESHKDDGGALGKINYGSLSSNYDELIDAAKNLKDGEYSTKVITTELGYHVILKTKSYEKDTLDNLKDKIRETLGEEYITANQNSIGLTALQHYRKDYDMAIEDDELKQQYQRYITNALASINAANTETNNEQ